MKNTFKNLLPIKNIIIAVSSLLIAYNSFYLFVYVMSQVVHNEDVLLEPGTQFKPFKVYLKNQKKIGFLTDKDMSPEHNDGFFSQTQYILAPTIIELNNPNNTFNILNYSQNAFFVYSIMALNATRITSNEYGQALIRRKP